MREEKLVFKNFLYDPCKAQERSLKFQPFKAKMAFKMVFDFQCFETIWKILILPNF